MYYVLDAGHGKCTKGKRSPDGQFLEYQFNRDIARRVGEELRRLGISFSYTYNLDDEGDLRLSKRAEAANRIVRKIGSGNVLLISLHSNAMRQDGTWSCASGYEIYTTKGQTQSDKYARVFEEEAKKVCAKYGRKYRGLREENFTVIYMTICPSLLLEQFFYDNKEELKFLQSEEGKNACVEVIINAIQRIEKEGIR